MLASLHKAVTAASNPTKAQFLMRFFKTGEGQYAEGDIFAGLTVPQSRAIAVQYRDLSLADVSTLLTSPIHEERLIALLILVARMDTANDTEQKKIVDCYLAHTKYINNWDLVDLSADKILGLYLLNRDRFLLYKLARSSDLWEKRIAIISTFKFIKEQKECTDTFAIADILLQDQHDLIQKAVGWMLREVGKRVSEKVLQDFLVTRYQKMPRTMLRYAIERFPETVRKQYLRGTIT